MKLPLEKPIRILSIEELSTVRSLDPRGLDGRFASKISGRNNNVILELKKEVFTSFCYCFSCFLQAKQPSKLVFLFLKDVLIQMLLTLTQLQEVMMEAVLTNFRPFLGFIGLKDKKPFS